MPPSKVQVPKILGRWVFGSVMESISLKSSQAKEFYEQFVERVKSEYQPERVKDGVFGGECEP